MKSTTTMFGYLSSSLLLSAALLLALPNGALADSATLIRGLSSVSLAPIAGAATDCSEYENSVSLPEAGMTMSYVMIEDSPPRLAVEVVYDGLAWVSIGFCGDTRCKMIGSEAVIGVPDLPESETNPGKYHLTSEQVQGVYLRDLSEQTLLDTSLTQTSTQTIMRFTKLLQEPGEVQLVSQGEVYLMWAYGFVNQLSPHDKKTGAGAFLLDVTSPCVPPPPTSAPVVTTAATTVPSPTTVAEPVTPQPVTAVTSVPSPPPTAAEPVAPQPVAAEQEDTEDEDDGEEEDDEGDEGPVVQTNPDGTAIGDNLDCSTYQQQVSLSNALTMSYVVNNETMSVKLEYDAEAWIAFGVSPDGSGKMIGSEAVTALPSIPVGYNNPGKYRMAAETQAGVFLMPDQQQTLFNTSITQSSGKTIMTFTKKLVESNEIAIDAYSTNTFLWAVGFNNDLNLHMASGAFQLNLWPCGVPGGSSTFTSLSTGSLSAEQQHKFWKSHAYLGFFAWGVFAPIAFSASFLRKFLQKWDPLWFKIHIYMNSMVLVLSIAAFAIAVSVYKDSKKELFQDPHGIVGLVITILVILQAGNGLLRPPAPKPASATTKADPMSYDAEEAAEAEADTAVEVTNHSSSEFQRSETDGDDDWPSARPTQKRAAWEIFHKVVIGFSLLGMGLYQIYSGLDLYSEKYLTKDYQTIYWGVLGGVIGVIVVLKLYLRMKDRA